MPNHIIDPKTLAIILLASTGLRDVSSFVIQIPEQLLAELKTRGVNMLFQYGAVAVISILQTIIFKRSFNNSSIDVFWY